MEISKITNSFVETKEFAKKVAEKLLDNKNNRKKAQVLALTGDLGSGKTTFIQGLAKGLGVEEKILSPTFMIFKKFKIQNPDFYLFYHIDCYRLRDPEELLALGFEDFINNAENIIAIEWADKIKDILPENKISVNFRIKGKTRRKITIK